MDKLDIKEKIWGGVFGVAAILAAIAEMIANGITLSSIFGAIKDVAGTLVVVVILIAFFSANKKPKNIMEILENAVELWGEANAPLIFKTEEYIAAQDLPYSQVFALLQDPKSYVKLANNQLQKGSTEWHKYAVYGRGNHLTGKFIDMPGYDKMTQNDFVVLVTMEQSHFKNMPDIDATIDQIATAANLHCPEQSSAARVGKSRTIKVSCNKITTRGDVEAFVDELDFILSLVKVIA